MIAGIFRCMCTHPIDPMGIKLLCCAHNNECMGTHDAICNTFATIVGDVVFHVGQEQPHVLPSTRSTSIVNESTLCSPEVAFTL